MNIIVLAGGLSTERDVSIISGTQVCRALRKRGHRAVLLDVFFGTTEDIDLDNVFEERQSLLAGEQKIDTREPDLNEIQALRKGESDGFFGPNVLELCRRADIVYMGLHGAEGENGKIQAAFDMLGIRYTGSGYLGSAVAMDKGMAKKVFLEAGIPTPEGYSVTRQDRSENGGRTAEGSACPLGYPCVVKPCCGGSSVGVSIVGNDEEFARALEVGFRYEDELLVEKCIRGREFSVGVIDGKSLPVIEIIPKSGFYNYENKYQPGMAADVCPAELSAELTQKMQDYAVQVFRELKLDTYGRIDFLLDDNDQMFCLEANTLPGMTPTSLLPQEALAVGIEYGELCEQIIGKSLEKYEEKKKLSAGGCYGRNDMIPVWTSPMTGMTLEKIAAACGGTYYGPVQDRESEVSMITTDSRQIEEGCLFVAIRGSRVDGNNFVPSAYEGGALCCMSETAPEGEDRPYIVVKSCLQALKDMAELYREILGIRLIGITGSVGKTTTKEMIAAVLSEKFPVCSTQGNFNNEVGVPLTIFRLRKEHAVGVIEMGISEFGEMERLSAVVKPDACVITNIGQCHLENLGDRDGVLRAKTEIFSSMKPDGTIYLNGEDDKLVTVRESGGRQIVFFGGDESGSIRAENLVSLGLKGSRFTVVSESGKFEVTVPAPGKHMVLNALAAAAVALDAGMTPEEISAGISKFHPIGGHGSIVETEQFVILDDCYNANPASMKAGIDVLRDGLGRKVAVVGDMFELGDGERELHGEIGSYAIKAGINVLVCVGTLSKFTYDAAVAAGGEEQQAYYFETLKEAQDGISAILQRGDTVLVKASHGMHFEKIVAQMKEM